MSRAEIGSRASESPGISSIDDPEAPDANPKASAVRTSGRESMRVDRTETAEAVSGCSSTSMSTWSATGARLVWSCVCMRSSTSRPSERAPGCSDTDATFERTGTATCARRAPSTNAVDTEPSSHALGPPSTSASAMLVAAYCVGNQRWSGTRYVQVGSKNCSE